MVAKDKVSKKSPIAETSKKVTRNNKADKLPNKFLKLLDSVRGYFKGAWSELRQVRWPNRKATWGMTAAVLLFTGAFVLLIVSLDAIFSQLFNLIIK